MVILLFVVAVIVLIERVGGHYRMVRAFEQRSLPAAAVIEGREPSETLGWYAVFQDEQGQERSGFIEPAYYPEALQQQLAYGAEIRIRYLPESYASELILDGRLDDVRFYWGYARDVLWVLLVCWVLIIVHPEALYIAYVDPFSEKFKKGGQP